MIRVVFVALALVAGCSSAGAGPRALTTAEAERLALVRYTNYEAAVSTMSARIPTSAGTLVLAGRVDFVNHIGQAYMTMEGRTDPTSAGLLQWTPRLLAFRAGASVEPLPADGWQYRSLQERASELDAALLLLLNLASDRPDNPQLLQQSTARWLRSDTIGSTPVDVIEGPTPTGGPAHLPYWVDANGNLPRLQARLTPTPTDITLTPGAPPLTPLPTLA
jgi:hypothetical protein